MILDERTEFADAAAVGALNNTTGNVGDIIDLTVARDIGQGHTLWCVIQVTTAFTSGGSATVNFKLVSDATTTIATNGTATLHHQTATFAIATLVAGYQIAFQLPMENQAYERYLAVQATEAAGQALTAGSINAFLTHDVSKYKAYADAAN